VQQRAPVHHHGESEFLVFVFDDPTKKLGEDEVKLHMLKDKLEIVPVTSELKPVAFKWGEIQKVMAKQNSEEPDEMDLLIIVVDGVGIMTFETEDARGIRRACASFHPTLLLSAGAKAALPSPSPSPKPAGKGDTNSLLKALHVYTRMNHLTKLMIVDEAQRLTITEGECLFKAGEPVNGFFIVTSGLLTVWTGETELAELHTGQPFGHTAFLKNEAAQRSTTVHAANGYGDNDVTVLMINTELFESIKNRRHDFMPALRKCPLDLAEYHGDLLLAMRHDRLEVFVFNDPSGSLPTGDAPIGIYCSKVALQILEIRPDNTVKVLLSYHWDKITEVKAKMQAENEPDMMEVVEFEVKGVGSFTFECENSLDLRKEIAAHAKHHHPHHVHDAASSAKYDANEHLEYDHHDDDDDHVEGETHNTKRKEWTVLLEGGDPFNKFPHATDMVLYYSDTVIVFANATTHKLLASFPWHDLHDCARDGILVTLDLFTHEGGEEEETEVQLILQCEDEEAGEQLVADLHYMTHACGSKSGRMVMFKSLAQAVVMIHRLATPHDKDEFNVPHSEHATAMHMHVISHDLERQDEHGHNHGEQLTHLTKSLDDDPESHNKWIFDYSQFPVHTFKKEFNLPDTARVTESETMNGRDVFIIESEESSTGTKRVCTKRAVLSQFREFRTFGLHLSEHEDIQFPDEYLKKGVALHMLDLWLHALVERGKGSRLDVTGDRSDNGGKLGSSVASLVSFLYDGGTWHSGTTLVHISCDIHDLYLKCIDND
jgi:hypothetical protein